MTLQRKTQSRLLRFLFVLVGIVIAVSGFLLVVYYTHLVDSARWFYAFRTSRFSEISVCGLGWIAGAFYSWLDPETLGGKRFWPAALFAFVSFRFIPTNSRITVPEERAFKQPIQPAVQRVQPAYWPRCVVAAVGSRIFYVQGRNGDLVSRPGFSAARFQNELCHSVSRSYSPPVHL